MTATGENLGFTPAPSDLRGQLKGPINNGLIATTATELDRNELGTVNGEKVPSPIGGARPDRADSASWNRLQGENLLVVQVYGLQHRERTH